MEIQLREFTSGADLRAHYAAIRARREALQAPVRVVPAPPIAKPAAASHSESVAAPMPEPASDAMPPQPALATILKAVCLNFGVTRNDVISARRDLRAVRPRQVMMYLAKSLTRRSLPEIGRYAGMRDHTTVLHGVRRITALRLVDTQLNESIVALERELCPPAEVPDANQLTLPFVGGKGSG
jgi:hypothetical protein